MPPVEFMQRLAATVSDSLSQMRWASLSGCIVASGCCIGMSGSGLQRQFELRRAVVWSDY
jgi:hypothetical protein